MADPQSTLQPPAFGEAGLLTQLLIVRHEDLAGHREDLVVREAFKKGCEKPGVHAHVAVQEDNDLVSRCLEALVGSGPKSEIAIQGHHANAGVVPPHEIHAIVLGPVVDHNHFAPRMVGNRRDHRRQILFEQVAPVPVGNDNARRSSGGPLVRGRLSGECQRNQISDRKA